MQDVGKLWTALIMSAKDQLFQNCLLYDTILRSVPQLLFAVLKISMFHLPFISPRKDHESQYSTTIAFWLTPKLKSHTSLNSVDQAHAKTVIAMVDLAETILKTTQQQNISKCILELNTKLVRSASGLTPLRQIKILPRWKRLFTANIQSCTVPD